MKNAFGHFVAGSIVAILIGYGLLVYAQPKVSLPDHSSILILQGDGR